MAEARATTPSTEPESKAMLDVATPDLYRHNAFRILNLPTTVTPSDLSRQQKKLKLMEKLGARAGASEPACLPLDPAPDSEAIRRATQRLHDPVIRLIDELFWFWPLDHQSSDDEGLRLLRAGDVNAAASRWINQHKHDGADGWSASHNLAVLNHALALDIERSVDPPALGGNMRQWRDHYWQQAFQNWRAAAEHDGFWIRITSRVRELDDPRLTTGVVRRIRQMLPAVILGVSVRLAVQLAKSGSIEDAKRHLGYIRDSGLDLDTAKALLERELTPLLDQIRMVCEAASSAAKTNPSQAAETAQRLLTDVQPLLAPIQAILNERHHLRQIAQDTVSRTLRDCTIDYGNSTERWTECLALLQSARQFASEESLQARLDEDLAQVQKNLRQEQEYLTLKKSVTSHQACDVTVKGGRAVVPNVCTCCLGKPDSEETVSYSWEETRGVSRYKRTLSFAFPICAACRRHQGEYHRKRWGLVLLASGASTAIMWLIATAISKPEFVPFALGGAVFTIAFLFGASTFIKVSALGEAHACRDEAVSMTSASDSHTTFRFQNPLYGDAFARANEATANVHSHSKPPRGTYLLTGRGLVFPIIASLILGVIGHGIVYAVMEDSWNRAPSRYSSWGTSGSSPRRSSPSPPAVNPFDQFDRSPTIPSAPQPTVRSPSYSSSGLSGRIDAAKVRVKGIEAEVGRLDEQLESLSSRLNTYKRDIDGYESRARLGLDVNEVLYQRAIDSHNSLVSQYNSLLADRNLKYAEYQREIDAVNAMVRRYNNGER